MDRNINKMTKDQKGLQPDEVVIFLKCHRIPFKEEYLELLKLLQVPEIWNDILSRLKEILKLSINRIESGEMQKG